MISLSRRFRGSHLQYAARPYSSTKHVVEIKGRSLEFTPGDQYGTFRITDVKAVPWLDMAGISLIHEKTGARHLHIARDDPNNVFSIGFKTNPPDKSGLPHILEHTTLCGSARFPVRDPFFKMLTRSLSNFMNAMTDDDHTFYPFSTTNHTDYRNLQEVYLDAVYNPLLRETDFLQEGWRIEHTDVNDQSSPLEYKGVVYNEMKGQMSNPGYLFHIGFMESIYPSLQNSGGDPAYITTLSHEKLKAFHADRYHPSNSFSFSYGDISLEEVLEPLEAYLAPFTKKNVSRELLMPVDIAKNRSAIREGPFDPLFDKNRQFKVSLSWVLGSTRNLDEVYAWKVLSLLLLDGHSSPLRQALIDTGLGTDFTVNTGIMETPEKVIFSIGLEGLNEESIAKFKEALFDVLRDITTKGISEDRVQATLNQAELSDRQIRANLGMGFVYSVFPRVFNEVDPLSLIDSKEILEAFKAKLSDSPNLFQRLIADNLLNSPYFEFTIRPEENYESDIIAEEAKRLEEKVSKLTEADRDALFSQGLTLSHVQQQQDDLSLLPTLSISDIDSLGMKLDPSVITTDKGVPLLHHSTQTNDITYVNILKNIADIPKELLVYLPLYVSALTNVGTIDKSMEQIENEMRLNIGSLSPSLLVRSDPKGNVDEGLELHVAYSGFSLDEKVPYLFGFLEDFLLKSNYKNIEKIRWLIQSTAANLVNSLSQSGHSFAMGHARSFVSREGHLSETISGLEQVKLMQRLAEESDEDLLSMVVPKLLEISSYVNTRGGLQAGITQTPGDKNHEELLDRFFTSLEVGGVKYNSTIGVEASTHGPQRTQIVLPFQVSHLGAAMPCVKYSHSDSAPLQVLATLLTHNYMHPEVREKGGAYGGGASYSPMMGTFGFYSYRDPNPSGTVSVIERVGDWALHRTWSDTELRESKLNIFQSVDSPRSPSSYISPRLYYQITDEMRQRRREALLSVTETDVHRVTEKYLVGKNGNVSISVLGPENEMGNDWQTIRFDK